MQKPQYTHDATYKYTLWRKLWEDRREEARRQQRLNPICVSGQIESNVAAYVLRTAFGIVQELLPRRTYEPCCLCGSCFPSRGSTTSTFVHSALHPGRCRIEPADGVRDEDCFCLAHSTACLGDGDASDSPAPAPLPMQLTLHSYRSSSGNGKDPWRGLRCLLRHVPLSEASFFVVNSAVDADELLGELRMLLLLQQQRDGRSVGTRAAAGLRRLTLCKVAATPRGLHDFFHDIVRADTLTSLFLQFASLTDLAALSGSLVRGSSSLTELSLRGSKQVDKDGWPALGAAVAANPSLIHLDVSDCDWTDEVLCAFLQSFTGFAPRAQSELPAGEYGKPPLPRFTLNLSENLSLKHVWLLLSTAAPPEFHPCLTSLCLAGNTLDSGEEGDIPAFFAQYTALRSLNVGFGLICASAIQRLTRCLAEQRQDGGWERIDFQAITPMPPRALKRLTQLSYAPDAGALLLCAVDLRDSLLKAGFASCLAVLSEVNLSTCWLRDEDLQQLAAALEKAPVLSLRVLRLGYNDFGTDKRKGESALSYLCKALRATHAPVLQYLDLAHNGLSLRPVLSLMEQVTPALKKLVLSSTPVAEDPQSVTMLLSTVMKRQKGSTSLKAFSFLDMHCRNSEADLLITNRAILDWLWRQSAVRFIYKERD